MKVHVYSLCWNEARMLPYYVRHYQPIADQFFIYDDGSTDGSLDYLSNYPNIQVRRFENNSDSFVLNSQRFTNEAWKQSRGQADWVIICNIDEHLYHPDLPNYLKACMAEGVTVIPAQGYQMVADEFPDSDLPLCHLIKDGMAWEAMNKPAIFNPNAVEEIGYAVGRHTADPKGHIQYPQTVEMRLLHYKYLGLDYLVTRHAELKSRLKAKDIENQWGYHYFWDKTMLTDQFLKVKSKAITII